MSLKWLVPAWTFAAMAIRSWAAGLDDVCEGGAAACDESNLLQVHARGKHKLAGMRLFQGVYFQEQQEDGPTSGYMITTDYHLQGECVELEDNETALQAAAAECQLGEDFRLKDCIVRVTGSGNYSEDQPKIVCLIEKLGLSRAATVVEPDGRVEAAVVKADAIVRTAELSQVPWGLDRVDQRDLPLNSAFAPSNDGAGVHVFVLDTGVDISHAEFGGRAFNLADCTSSSGCNLCNGNANCALDVDGHGTHCAGTVAGASTGVATAAWIGGVKVLGDDGSGSFSGIVAGMDEVVTYVSGHADRRGVMSMSLGGRGTSNAMRQAVAHAAEKSIITVVAAGNSNADACSFTPAGVAQAVTVGSTTSSDSMSSFSNYGTCVDIFAPGSSILSAATGGGYTTLSGTSMACPHVAGAAALVLQSNRGNTVVEITNVLLADATDGKVLSLPTGSPNKLLFVGDPCEGSDDENCTPSPTPSPAPPTTPPPC